MKRTILALAAVLCGTAASAQSDMANLSLLPGWRQADGTHMAAIDIRLAPGWKTYWRAPGDAGIAPSFDWSGSHNVGAVHVHWPSPKVFGQNGLTSVGYDGGVVLPVTVVPLESDAPVDLRLTADIGVCSDICVPFSAGAAVRLPETGAADGRISGALSAQPAAARAADVRCEVARDDGEVTLTVRASVPALAGESGAVIEVADPDLWVTGTRLERQGREIAATAEVVPPRGRPVLLDRTGVRLTVLGAGRAVEIVGCD